MQEQAMVTQDAHELTSGSVPAWPAEHVQKRWYAAYTCARHEKRVCEQMERKLVETFLPLYETVRQWKDRRVQLSLPLFPGYVFVRIPLKDRLQVLELPSVVRLVGFNGHPAPLADAEMDALREGLSGQLRAAPHLYLRVGRQVRIKNGPLKGAQGILIRRKNLLRVVLSIDLIARSISVEVDAGDIEPIS